MLKFWQKAKLEWILTAIGAALLLLIIAPALHASGKKKMAQAPAIKPGDQRITEYFDVSKIVWPNPPAIARIKFVDLFTGEKIDRSAYEKKQKEKQKWMDRLAGAQSTDEIKPTSLPFQLIRPYGVASDSKGRIYAADQAVGAIFIFNPEDKDHVEFIKNGKEAHFGELVGLAMDDDRLFAVDAKLHRVNVFSSTHALEATFGGDDLIRPAGIAIDRENRFAYVADPQNDCVAVYDADTYKLLRRLGKPSRKHDATEPGLFSLPDAVAVDSDGNVYVTDTFNDRVEVFDSDGQFISTFGQNGDGPADFQRPKGIAVDGDGHIWVVDAVQARVKVFDREGHLLIYFGQEGSFPGQFNAPWGVAIDRNNRVLVSETYLGRVQLFRYVTDQEAAELKKQKEEAAQAKRSGFGTQSGDEAAKRTNAASAQANKTATNSAPKQ